MQHHDLLFVQGAGEGAHAEDQALATYLKSAVAPDHAVRYPKFTGLENVTYETWKDEMAAELKASGDPSIVVAHSLGGAAVLKYLAEERRDLSLAGLFLIGTPYKCTDGEWGGDDFALAVDFAKALPSMGAIVLYHSEDDEWVPFSHLARWAEKLPGAISRPFTDRGHSFSAKAFPELIADIRSL
jgi:predicted alpha/beta hydrolase family esterase